MNRFSSLNIFSIRQYAEEFLDDPQKPTDLDNILLKENIRLREFYIGKDNKGHEVLGACKIKGLNKLIIISPSITNYQRKRFTIAHEIGHIIIHHKNLKCITTDFDPWRDIQTEEIEANYFASELLIPYSIAVNELKTNDISFSMIEKIAGRYKTSISSTAIRLAKLDSGMTAIIYHDGKNINWVVRSLTCPDSIESSVISKRSLYTYTNESNLTVKDEIDPNIWFNDEFHDDWICSEETHYFRPSNSYLTIINIWEQ